VQDLTTTPLPKPPRPLPPWVSRLRVQLYSTAVCASVLAALVLAAQHNAAAGVPGVMAAAFAALLLWELRKRRVLTTGVGARGTVAAVSFHAGAARIEYFFEAAGRTYRASTGMPLEAATRYFGRELGPGAGVIVAFEAQHPEHSCLWGLVGVPDAIGCTRRRPVLTWLGILLVGAFGVPLAGKLARTVEAERVRSCEATFTHRHYAHVALASGKVVTLTSDDISDPERCVGVGRVLEKRFGERSYRIDGNYSPSTSDSWVFGPAGLILGAALVAFDVLRRRG